MSFAKSHIKIGVSLLFVAGISGCASNPSALSPTKILQRNPGEATVNGFIQSNCKENQCELPIEYRPSLISNPGADFKTAVLAATMKEKIVPETPRNMTSFPNDTTPATVPTTNLASSAGTVAMGAGMGDVGMGLSILGMMASASQYKPAKTGYRISPTIPYLSFYRFYPKKWLGKVTMNSIAPILENGVELVVSAHDGARVKPGSLDFSGNIIWGNRSQHSGPASFVLAKPSGVSRNAIILTWAANGDVSHCHVSAFPVSFIGKMPGSNERGFAIAVRTGQPKNFYTPAQVKRILDKIPDSKEWYAVFNMPGEYDLAHQYALHDGKMYRVAYSQPHN